MYDARNLIRGEWVTGAGTKEVLDKFTGEPVTTLHPAAPEQVTDAVGAVAAAQAQQTWTASDRYQVLATASRLVAERAQDLIDVIVADTGFPVSDAVTEVRRAEQTLLLSAEAARTLTGEMVPLEGAPGVHGRMGFTMRFPVGVVGAVTPFNSPLNTVAHKVAPALAAGNGVVLKPANTTPASANALGQLLLDAGLPEGLLSIVHGSGSSVGNVLVSDDRLGFVTFTGSTEVGLAIHRAAGLRRTQLELGSIASTIVCADADPDRVVGKVAAGAFRKGGQVCTSIQRLYVQSGVVDDVLDRLVTDLAARNVGDPRQPDTFVGPLISVADAERVESWVNSAAEAGAKVLCGGERDRAVVTPAVLVGVTTDMEVGCREIFGPVVCVLPFDTLEDAVEDANATQYGLAAGIFTRDLDAALWAARRLRFGGVHINETSSSRVDLMPFGGVKASGHGREGPLYAAREMTEERLVTISPSP